MSKRSAQLPQPLTSSILAFAMLCALPGCASQPRAPTITVPSTFREACASPTSPLLTLGDLGALSVRQKEAIDACNAKRAGLVEIIEGANKATAPRKRFGVF